MRSRQVLALAMLIVLASPAPVRAATASVERATASVVAITSYADRIGTGVVIAEDRVLTVAHVVDAADGTPTHVIAGDLLLTYSVLALDRTRDLALLAVDVPEDVPAIVWGDGGALTLGQDVIALGFPIGLKSVTLSKGVVSSPAQIYDGATYIQTDAAINPGNSGGPLVDGAGRLVGINVGKVADVEVDAVGFAIPAADAIGFLKREAPEIEILVDTASSASAVETQVEPVVTEQRSPVGLVFGIIGLVVALVLVALARISAARRRTSVTVGEVSPETGRAVPRVVFRITSPAGQRDLDLRLPSVAGTAANADIPLRGEGIAAYHVRFSPSAGGVSALDLTDGEGMYCADACVLSADLDPGESVRIGATTIELVRTYEG